MASLGANEILSSKNSPAETIDTSTQKQENVRKARDREDRLRLIKDRQNEERQKKLEELKAQAFAAQKYREQKEEERKRRIDEMRLKENDKRQQVEDRKKAIMDAEKERREYILRKNQERDARLETKRRNERSSISFAFGSSTPRLLDPVEVSLISPSGSYWGHRRSTSISNVSFSGGNGAPLSRRSSERELADGPKKRATSAGGLDRPEDDSNDSSPLSYRSVARRKTDLMPTIPSPRDSNFGSRTSLYCHTPRTQGSRSGDVTPGGSSRPGSAMSSSTTASGVVYRRTGARERKQRPASIAGTGMTQEVSDAIKQQRKDKPPVRPSSAVRKSTSTATSNSPNTSSTGKSTSGSETPKRADRRVAAKKTSTPRATTPQAIDSPKMVQSMIEIKTMSTVEPIEITNAEMIQSVEVITPITTTTTTTITTSDLVTETVVVDDVKADDVKAEEIAVDSTPDEATVNVEITTEEIESVPQNLTQENLEYVAADAKQTIADPMENTDMTASMIQRRINTEEEAKAALAERRRLAREEAERQAELERQRLEAERQAELQRQAEEEERQRKLEEETLRLVEEQRRAEEQRLQQAIEEAKQREADEKRRKEEEERQKIEREEQERKARDEAEKQKAEVAERLKKEEKEREERRKRVEAIMSRTRTKGNASTPGNTPSKTNDDKDAGSNNDSGTESTTNSKPAAVDSSNVHMSSPTSTTAEQTSIANDVDPKLLADYEKTVTDKENAMIHTFSNLIDNNLLPIQPNQQQLQQQQQQQQQQQLIHQQMQENNLHSNLKTNGKLLDFDPLSVDDQNDIIKAPISNGNGHTLINNLDNKIERGDIGSNNFSDSITNQLLDLTIDSNQTSDHTVNFNNNSLISSAALVTSDSHDAKEISLL